MPNPDLTIRYAQVDAVYEAVLEQTAPGDDGPIWMVNLMQYKAEAEYADGRPTTLTGQEADDTYAPFEAFAEIGAELVFVAEVDTQLLGDEPHWDRVAVVKYPTRRSFWEMQYLPSFVDKHAHKDAGMAHTFVLGAHPLPVPDLPVDAPDWPDVPHPPTDDDPSVVVLHVIRFHEGGAGADMVEYQNEAGRIAVPHGVRLEGWLQVEGTVMGDGRTWDQARFNAFPSKAAFMAVALDPDRLDAQREHRETAIADTYTMILRPLLDRLQASFEA